MDVLMADEFLPSSQEFPALLRRMTDYLSKHAALAPETVLTDFLGNPTDADVKALRSVDHIAMYAGDYREEEQLSDWHQFLLQNDAASDITTGISYIARQHYDTEGHWAAGSLHGMAFEVFDNRHSGRWAGFAAGRRALRMSHFALLAEDKPSVLPLLRSLSAREDIEILSYSQEDDLGHTYGHVVNILTDRVLEIVSH